MSPRQRTPEQGRNSAPRLPVSCGISRAGKGTRKARDTLSRWQSTGTPGLHRAAPPRGRADGVGAGRSREAENTGDARLQRARGWLCVARQNGRVWPGQRRGRAAGQRVPRRRDRGRPSGKAAPSRRLQRTSRSRQQCLRAGDSHAPRAAAPPGCAAPALACKPQPGVHLGPLPGPGACDLPTPTLAGPSREQPWAAGRADCSCTTPSALPPWEAAAAPTMAPQHCDLNRGTVRVLREHGLRPRDRSRVGTSRRADCDAGEDARFPAVTGRLAACLGCLRARCPGWSLLHPLRPSNMEPH